MKPTANEILKAQSLVVSDLGPLTPLSKDGKLHIYIYVQTLHIYIYVHIQRTKSTNYYWLEEVCGDSICLDGPINQVSKRSNQPSLFDLIVQFVNFAFSAFSHFF